MDTGGAGGRMNWEPGSDTCTAMCKAEGRNLLWITGSSAWCAVTDEWVERGWEGKEAQEGADVYIHIAGSLFCTVETNATL